MSEAPSKCQIRRDPAPHPLAHIKVEEREFLVIRGKAGLEDRAIRKQLRATVFGEPGPRPRAAPENPGLRCARLSFDPGADS